MTDTSVINNLPNLKIIKKFNRHNHAESVYLLEGNIVKKTYPNSKKNIHYFKKEIKMMTHLANCKFVAKLIHFDRPSLTLYMTYCGKTPSRSSKNLTKIRKTAQKLHKKYGVYRLDNGKLVYDIYLPNTGIKDGKIYFFDLASDKWHINKKFKKL
jgi:hypothetical protein